MRELSAVSLFSNCGAGDVGYRKAGFSFHVMAELDPRRLEICLLNHPGATGVPGDLRETWPDVVAQYRLRAGDVPPDLVAACPPCQGISSVRSDRGPANDPDAGSKDQRNLLVVVIAYVALELKPNLIVVENVPAFLTRKVRHPETNEPISAAKLLVSLLDPEYFVFPLLADLCEYGVPQRRKRAFLTFVKRDAANLEALLSEKRAPYPRPTHAPDYGCTAPATVHEALSAARFPPLDAKTFEAAGGGCGNLLHSVPVWPERQYSMVEAISPGSGKSAWENDVCGDCGRVDGVGRDDVLCPQCGEPLLRPVIELEDGSYRFIRGFRNSSYRRMRSDRPAATITTASGHVGASFTIHPTENRVLSPSECAYLQTFPRDFEWGQAIEKWGHTNVREMIGEAVPPRFTHLHGQALKSVLTGTWSVAPITACDERCVKPQKILGLIAPSR